MRLHAKLRAFLSRVLARRLLPHQREKTLCPTSECFSHMTNTSTQFQETLSLSERNPRRLSPPPFGRLRLRKVIQRAVPFAIRLISHRESRMTSSLQNRQKISTI